jgi:hypothetical protein
MKWSKVVGSTVNPIELSAKLSGPLSMLTDTDVYNWGADNTRRMQRSLAKATAGTGYSDHLILGEGQTYQKTGHDNRWPNLLRANLAAKGVPVGGTGWVRTSDGYDDLDSRVTTTGAWTFRQPYYETTANGATMTFAADVAGTAISVAYFNTSAGFTVAVDGGSPVTVTPSGASTVGTYSVTGLTDTTRSEEHNIRNNRPDCRQPHPRPGRCSHRIGIPRPLQRRQNSLRNHRIPDHDPQQMARRRRNSLRQLRVFRRD